MRIGLLDDDVAVREFAQKVFDRAGHVCHAFADGRLFIRKLQYETYDLVLLDWMLPGITGVEVLRWIRDHLDPSPPVLFMTSRGQDSDIASVLKAGADDYVVKPAAAQVLLARAEALVRRTYRSASEITVEEYGPYRFDLGASVVSVNGQPVTLAQKEFELALLLFRNLGKPMSRGHILDSVWKSGADSLSRTVDTHMSVIRTKLDLRPQNGFRIISIYGYGYRLESVSTVTSTASG